MAKAKEAQQSLEDSACDVAVIEAINDGDWLSSKWAVAMAHGRKKKDAPAAAPAASSDLPVDSHSHAAAAAAASQPAPPAPAIPILLQRMNLMASKLKSSSTAAAPASSSAPAAAALSDTTAASAIQVVLQQGNERQQPKVVSNATPISEPQAPFSSIALSVSSAASKSGVGWSKMQSSVMRKASGGSSAAGEAALSLKQQSSAKTSGDVRGDAATLQQHDTYVLCGLVDRRHLNGTVVTIVPEDNADCAGNPSDATLLQLPDGSRIRLRPRNFRLLQRASLPLAVDSHGLCEGEFVNAEKVEKQKTQSLIKNKLTSSSRTDDEAAADSVSVKRLQSCIAAQLQSPLDENVAADLHRAVLRSSSWAIVEALFPSHLSAAFSMPQQELQLLMDSVMVAASQELTNVLKSWGRSATEMAIIPLACLKSAARAYETWCANRPVWPSLAADEARSAGNLFCSCTRALKPLLCFDGEDVQFASQVICLYMTVIREEHAAFCQQLLLLQTAFLATLPPPHVDAWRSDPLHAALSLMAHALSLLCTAPKSFASLRLPHPRCFCPSSATSLCAREVNCCRDLKDCRWEQCLWQLMRACVGAYDVCGLQRLQLKLCSDRAIILSRCISRSMQLAHASSLGFADCTFRLGSIPILLDCSLRLAWGENYHVAVACCDVACEAFTLAASLSPSLAQDSVVQIMQTLVSLSVAEPGQEELQRAVEGKVHASSRLLQASSDSIIYRMLNRGGSEVSCGPLFAVHQRDLQKHIAALSASLDQDAGQLSPLSLMPTCSHRGHVLRVSALACLRVLLLRHMAVEFETALALRSVYR